MEQFEGAVTEIVTVYIGQYLSVRCTLLCDSPPLPN